MSCRALDARSIALATLITLGCGQSDKAARAAVGLGLGVAAAGVNRAVTGECWASCAPGQACDRARGVCVPIPCGGKCPPDERCVESAQGERCERRVAESAVPEEVEPAEGEWAEPASDGVAPADAGAPEDAGAPIDAGVEEAWDRDAGGYPPPPAEWGRSP